MGASGIAVPDSTLNRVFIVGQTATQSGTSSYTIETFDQANFTPVRSITIDNVVGAPTAFIRWGTNGLAFVSRVGFPTDFYGTGPGQLYVISGSFVKAASASSQPVNAIRLLPVQRTWGLRPQTGSDSGKRLSRRAVHHNPLAR